ncbi:MAG: DUF3592 domain-containing protein [Pseudomonadota bacterium]
MEPPKAKSKLALMGRWYIMFITVPLLLAVVFGIVAMVTGQKAQRLAGDGQTVQGTITGQDVRIERDSDGDSRRVYYLEVRFQAETRPVTTETKVSRGFFQAQDLGDTLPVRYWRPDPQVNEVEPGSTRNQRWFTTIFSALLLAGSGYAAIQGIGQATRWGRVRDYGERRVAVVKNHVRTSFKINNRSQYRVEWQDSAGAEGRSFLRNQRQLKDVPIGSEIWVYADPDGRLPSVWEMDVGTSAN